MGNEETKDLIESNPYSDLLEENDPDQFKRIVDLFNLNMQKKNLIRVGRIADIQDKITNQISDRVEKRVDEFSNSDLLTYFKTMQEITSKPIPGEKEIAQILVNQNNQVNINMEKDELNRESRSRIIAAIDAFMKKQKIDGSNDSQNLVYIDDEVKNVNDSMDDGYGSSTSSRSGEQESNEE